jgi:hypothetical protein
MSGRLSGLGRVRAWVGQALKVGYRGDHLLVAGTHRGSGTGALHGLHRGPTHQP